MKAVRIHDFGGPEKMRIEDLPIPDPKTDEILLRVCAASVNPVDYKTREGRYPAIGRDALPVTLGRDVAGVVERCGAQVQKFQPSDAAYALLSPSEGAFAEFVRIKAAHAAVKPMRLSFTDAAAVPLAALTAWQGLFDHGGLKEGQRVLIHGGAGGVGHFAVQFAKVAGAYVLTTVTGTDGALVRELGADEVIDYRVQSFERVARDLDLVFDLVGGETQERSWALLKKGGALVSTLGVPPQDRAAAHQVRAIGYQALPNSQELTEIADLIDAHRVHPVVAAIFPFTAVREAETVQQRSHPAGKIVLDLAA